MLRVVACLVLVGCGASKECRLEAEALGKLLEQIAVEPPSPLRVGDDIALVERADLAPREVHSGPLVEVTASGLRYESETVTTDRLLVRLDESAKRLDQDLRRGTIRPEWVPEPRLVYFAVDGAAPVQRVLDAVEAAREAGLTVPAFVFVAPVTVKPPPRTALDKKLDALQHSSDPSSRAGEFAELVERQLRQCPELKETFGAVASAETNRGLALARSVTPALVKCRCDVNMPELRSTLFRLLFIPRPLRIVQLDLAQPAGTIEVTGTTIWAEASKRVTTATRNIEFVVR